MTPFELAEPETLPEALALLDPDDASVRPIAGGTALMLMMKAGVFRPTKLVSGDGRLFGVASGGGGSWPLAPEGVEGADARSALGARRFARARSVAVSHASSGRSRTSIHCRPASA